MKFFKINAFKFFFFSFISFLATLFFLLFLLDVFIKYVPSDHHDLFGKVAGMIMFLFGASSIVSGAYCMFKKYKLI